MEDGNKPDTASTGELPWLRLATGVLQFIGGGLVALHQETPVPKKQEPENAADRESRARLEKLGLRVDHADKIRNAWTAPPSSQTTNTAQAPAIPTLSFEEFAAAAAMHLGSMGSSAPRDEVKDAGPSSPASAEESGPLVTSAPTTAPEGSASVARSPEPEVAERRRADADSCVLLLGMRVDALETKCQEIQILLMQMGSVTDEDDGMAHEPVATVEIREPVEEYEEKASTAPAREADDGGHSSPTTQVDADERRTVVQGPWAAEREEGGDDAASVSSGVAGSIYDAHERRVAALERTFEKFGRMVEGLAARQRGKGTPPE